MTGAEGAQRKEGFKGNLGFSFTKKIEMKSSGKIKAYHRRSKKETNDVRKQRNANGNGKGNQSNE